MGGFDSTDDVVNGRHVVASKKWSLMWVVVSWSGVASAGTRRQVIPDTEGLISHTCGGYAAMSFKDLLDERLAPVIRNLGIRMCSSKCMEYALDPWMDANLGGTHIRPRNDSIPNGPCSFSTCAVSTRCLRDHNDRVTCLPEPQRLGGKCRERSECHLAWSTCFQERCLCIPGYSYNPRQNRCDRYCKTYGTTMHQYPGLAIGDNNYKTYQLPLRMRQDQAIAVCAEKCVNESSAVCLSADFTREDRQYVCHLAIVKYIDVSSEQALVNQIKWIMLVRGCEN